MVEMTKEERGLFDVWSEVFEAEVLNEFFSRLHTVKTATRLHLTGHLNKGAVVSWLLSRGYTVEPHCTVDDELVCTVSPLGTWYVRVEEGKIDLMVAAYVKRQRAA